MNRRLWLGVASMLMIAAGAALLRDAQLPAEDAPAAGRIAHPLATHSADRLVPGLALHPGSAVAAFAARLTPAAGPTRLTGLARPLWPTSPASPAGVATPERE